jgi:hypothetical protein
MTFRNLRSNKTMTIPNKRIAGGLLLAGGLMLGTTCASAQSANGTVPDAQIESNVLRALASAPELSTQNIQSATVYGTVTLTGNVHDETLRTKAENLVARAAGVKKVVDQMTLGDTPPPTETAVNPDPEQGNVAQSTAAPAEQQAPPAGQVLLSDGTYGPPPTGQPASGSQPQFDSTNPPASNQQSYSQSAPQNQAPPPAYSQQGPPPPQGRQPMYTNNYAPPPGVPGGQRAGVNVTVPAGAVLRIRINRGLDSNHIQPGAPFDGTVLTDVVAGGAVAIPRGATVHGTVVDSKKAGVFKGEGELGLQINSLTLGGNVYPMSTQVWQREGRDKTVSTVNNTVGTSAVGAIFGAIVGGGKGAAIGAGVGAGAGLAGSAASPRGDVIVPPESVLTFTTAQPAVVKTVSEAEMARLSYAAGPGQPPPPNRPMRRYYSPYYGYYWGPAY